MLGAFIVAILVSIAAGLYPARKASRVNILEAIGYE
jgi:ABC-type antimicrobial peptide transport system permease subunit